MTEQLVVGIDLGGTKVRAGVVTEEGEIIKVIQEKVFLDQGPQGLINQLIKMVQVLQKKFSGIRRVGLASAGPLDPRTGRLLDPTNLHGKGDRWGEVKIVELLTSSLHLPVILENDAAATALAEGWKGNAKNCDNFVVMTLGTGLGVGIVVNGRLLRSGRRLHPEVGHVFLSAGDQSAPCGCGNFGCAEGFLSGVNFTERLAKRWSEKTLTGEILVERARANDPLCLEAFKEYGERFAQMVSILAAVFAPEKIFLAGGFSVALDLFLPQAQKLIHEMLSHRRVGVDLLPFIGLTQLGEEAGVLGGAYVALEASLQEEGNLADHA